VDIRLGEAGPFALARGDRRLLVVIAAVLGRIEPDCSRLLN
jgi:hypothetical protein